MDFDPEAGSNGSPSTNPDDWAQRAIQARDFECLETALLGLPGGDHELTDEIDTMVARVHSRGVNRVHHCLESGLQPEPWVLNAAVSFGNMHTRVCQVSPNAHPTVSQAQPVVRSSSPHSNTSVPVVRRFALPEPQ